eukprot:TRINITY_DN7725_c0_g2_i1.p1 TRINITY_DN7725_c0_g2~~TRINITY_DN7725_c0_g2_i1.p1  ORF type:complete len:235 (-),score=49.88 TRINITY_DN7725_c0_g2_i1:25-729(-)
MGISLQLIFGICGNLTALGIFSSPVRTFYGILKQKDVKDFSCVPYYCTFLNCCLWSVYSLVEELWEVLVINGVGFAAELAFIIIYGSLTTDKKKLFAYMVPVLMVSGIGVAIAFFAGDNAGDILGWMAFGLCMVMYASPLAAVRTVIEKKNAYCMPLATSVMCTLNGIAWTAYGIVTGYFTIWVPNGFGFFLGLVQLALFMIYPSIPDDDVSEKKKGDEKKAKETEMTNVAAMV